MVEMEVLGVVGGWLVCEQPDGLLVGIVWSDGRYHAECIIHRETGQVVDSETTLDDLASGEYVVRDAVPLTALDSPLGCVF